MNYRFIIYEKKQGLAVITLNRPEVLNALNYEMVCEIEDAVADISKSSDVAALIICGTNGNFAAGADIPPMLDLNPQQARERTFNRAYNMIENLKIPVVAAISGYALGGGLELALACDIRICFHDAKLGLPEIKLGIFPGAGGTQRLPAIIGAGRAKDMIFTGIPVNAAKALEYGLCNMVTDNDVLEEAVKYASQFLKLSTAALAGAKRAVNFGTVASLASGIHYEEELWSLCFSTEDQRIGMQAFMDKKKPIFTGK